MAQVTKLQMIDISKLFPGVKALDNVNFDLNEGEVHALIGENGAGKSTLIKILTGLYQKDSGDIVLNGKNINLSSVQDSKNLGIAAIYQEIDFIPIFTLAENIFLGKEPCYMNGKTNYSIMNKEAQKVLDYLDFKFDVKQPMMSLSTGQQQLLMIARALTEDANIIIVDEVTAALSISETKHFFKIINDLKKKGISIIYISHRIEEIFEIADRVTIMRDGKTISTKKVSKTNIDELISMMIGRKLKDRYLKVKSQVSDKIVLSVKNITQGNKVKHVSFNLYQNEILGFGGLVGSGRSETMKALYGINKKEKGQIFLDEKEIFINSAPDAIKAGIVLIPEERRIEGLVLDMDVKENVSLANLSNFCFMKNIIKLSKERKMVERLVKILSIKTPSINTRVEFLSGGNQQKVVFAKWLIGKARVFIFDEPTKGVDVGTKKEIYILMNKIIKEGGSIILISSDLPELLALSDRILIMHRGEIKGELKRQEASAEKILHFATSS